MIGMMAHAGRRDGDDEVERDDENEVERAARILETFHNGNKSDALAELLALDTFESSQLVAIIASGALRRSESRDGDTSGPSADFIRWIVRWDR